MKEFIDQMKEQERNLNKLDEEIRRNKIKFLVIFGCCIFIVLSFSLWHSYRTEKADFLAQTIFERMEYKTFENKDSEIGEWKRVAFESDGFLCYISPAIMDTSANESKYMYKCTSADTFQFYVNGQVIEGRFINYATAEDIQKEFTFLKMWTDGIPGRYFYKGTLTEGQLKLIDENGKEYILEQVK